MNELAKLLDQEDWPEPGITGQAVGWFDVAELPLPSGRMWVGDPGFSWAELADDEGLRVDLEPGNYRVQALVMAFGEANLIARLRVCAVHAQDFELGEELAEAGTDSASIGVCDAVAMLAAYQAKFADRNSGALFLEDYDFERAGTLRIDDGPSLVYVQSGFGDGAGPVYELLANSRRVGVELEFIAEGATS
jgi:hypothetical protein